MRFLSILKPAILSLSRTSLLGRPRLTGTSTKPPLPPSPPDLPLPVCITPQQLASSPLTYVPIDCSWYLDPKRDPLMEYFKGHLPGAKFYDMNRIAAKSPQNLPHMAPRAFQFSKGMSLLGVKPETNLLLYGGSSCFSVPRTYHLINHFASHTGQIRILEGGLPAYTAFEGNALESSFSLDDNGVVDREAEGVILRGRVEAGINEVCNAEGMSEGYVVKEKERDGEDGVSRFSKANATHSFVDMKYVSKVIAQPSKKSITLDARSKERFEGTAVEARKNLYSGHIPTSKSFPFQLICDSKDFQKLKSKDDMKAAFESKGVEYGNTEAEVILTCGSGVTASVLALGLEVSGFEGKVRVYDGSWSDWGRGEKEGGGKVMVGEEGEGEVESLRGVNEGNV